MDKILNKVFKCYSVYNFFVSEITLKAVDVRIN